MTKTLEAELLKIPNLINLEDGSFLLKKQDNSKLDFEKNKYYLIYIDESATANDILETTRVNWNCGQYLKSHYLKCELVDKQGIMVQLNASGFDPKSNIDLGDIYLNFWINRNIITILKCIS